MLNNLDFISEAQLTRWVNEHLNSDKFALSAGYQGKTLLFDELNHKLVIKAPLGNFFTRPVNLALLRHEYKIYQKLQGMDAVPVCYGMANNEFLVIEYIEGQTIRHNRPAADSEFFIQLLAAIKEMHARGVAHFDLKRSENLLVTHNCEPRLIDFGVSINHKSGLHWLNQFLYKLACQFDYNAWARHKYNKQMDELSEDDKVYYKKTAIETLAKKIKRFYKDKIIKTHKSAVKK
jgi:serine/threonine protein kinase